MEITAYPITLEALSCSTYDPWCYSDPEPGVEYLSHTDWLVATNAMRDAEMLAYYRRVVL
jgi:hypothetical protein